MGKRIPEIVIADKQRAAQAFGLLVNKTEDTAVFTFDDVFERLGAGGEAQGFAITAQDLGFVDRAIAALQFKEQFGVGGLLKEVEKIPDFFVVDTQENIPAGNACFGGQGLRGYADRKGLGSVLVASGHRADLEILRIFLTLPQTAVFRQVQRSPLT